MSWLEMVTMGASIAALVAVFYAAYLSWQTGRILRVQIYLFQREHPKHFDDNGEAIYISTNQWMDMIRKSEKTGRLYTSGTKIKQVSMKEMLERMSSESPKVQVGETLNMEEDT